MSDDEKLATDLRVTAGHLNLLMHDAADDGIIVEPLVTFVTQDGGVGFYSITLRISRPL